MNHISAKTNANPLDVTQPERYRSLVAVNPVTGFDSLIPVADSRRHAAFFTSVCNIIGASSMAGRGGDTFGYAGIRWAGLSTLLRACHPRLTADGRSNDQSEATMPKAISRALRALFPLHPVPVSTLATPYRFTVSGVAA